MRKALLNLIGEDASSSGSSLPPALLTNLVAWWKLNEASGTRINSVVANNALDLTPMNSPGTATGKIGNGVDFTSGNQYLTCSDNALLNPLGNGDFSIHFWVKFDATPQYYLFGQGSGNYNLVIGIFSSTVQVSLNSGGGGGANFAYSMTSGVWHNVVATVNRTGNNTSFYVDGVPIYTLGNAFYGPVYGGPLIVGNYAGGTLLYAPDGIMDEVAYWNRVLSPADVTALYNGGAGLTY